METKMIAIVYGKDAMMIGQSLQEKAGTFLVELVQGVHGECVVRQVLHNLDKI
jgi:hypothetical protein